MKQNMTQHIFSQQFSYVIIQLHYSAVWTRYPLDSSTNPTAAVDLMVFSRLRSFILQSIKLSVWPSHRLDSHQCMNEAYTNSPPFPVQYFISISMSRRTLNDQIFFLTHNQATIQRTMSQLLCVHSYDKQLQDGFKKSLHKHYN